MTLAAGFDADGTDVPMLLSEIVRDGCGPKYEGTVGISWWPDRVVLVRGELGEGDTHAFARREPRGDTDAHITDERTEPERLREGRAHDGDDFAMT